MITCNNVILLVVNKSVIMSVILLNCFKPLNYKACDYSLIIMIVELLNSLNINE